MRKALAALLLGLASCMVGSAAAHAGTQDFTYDSWHVSYEIGTDGEGRAIAKVTETVAPRFPDFDQNRGIVRGIPIDYEGASTDPRDFSVTDENGDPVPFEVEDDEGFRAVLVGDDSYVHGLKHYVIRYTLSDVVLARDDGRADEFYWDLMDFEHLQPVASFSARISFSPELAPSLNGDARCYIGAAESSAECGISADAEGTAFEIAPVELGPREGVTAAIGMKPGSVVQPSVRLPNFTLDVLPLAVGGVGLAVSGAGAIAVGAMRRKRRTARGTIVAQYDVPATLPPLLAAPLLTRTSGSPVSAEIVHLAVNGAVRIEDGEPEPGLFGSKPGQPVIRVVDPARAYDPLDRQALEALVPGATPGEAITLPKNNESFAQRMRGLKRAGDAEAVERGYFERRRSPLARRLGLVALVLLAALAVLAALGFALRNSATPVLAAIIGAVILILTISSISRHRVHTFPGAETREYLEGVREFIRVAEADRLQMLQSYSGAERQQDGEVDVVRVYEKLLPYAMLFGLEKEWSRVLEVKYQERQDYTPLWYPGVVAHGFGRLDSTLSQFTSSLNSSVSYTSSSSGGSSGGGFAGGGGGGGFSGGR